MPIIICAHWQPGNNAGHYLLAPPHPLSAVPAWRVPVVTLSVTLVRLLPKEAQAEARMASDRALHRLFGFVLLGPKCLGPCPHGLPSPIPCPPYHITIRSPLYISVCVCVCVRIPFQVSFVYASDVALLNYASVSDSPQSTLHPLRTHFLLPSYSSLLPLQLRYSLSIYLLNL